jgi:hypothetical protein
VEPSKAHFPPSMSQKLPFLHHPLPCCHHHDCMVQSHCIWPPDQQHLIKTLTKSTNELANSLNEVTNSLNELLTNTLSNVICSKTITMYLFSLILTATVQDSKSPVSPQPSNIKLTNNQSIYECTQKAQQRFLTHAQLLNMLPKPFSLISDHDCPCF